MTGEVSSVENEDAASVEYCHIGVALKWSGILQPDARQGLFASQLFGEKCSSGYYFDSFMNKDVRSGDCCFKASGESIMKVTRETFLK